MYYRKHFFISVSFIVLSIIIPTFFSCPAFSQINSDRPCFLTDDPLNLDLVAVITDGFPENRVLARVFDEAGNPILGLDESNFLLWENQIYTPIALDTTYRYMAVSLVMDQSGSMAGWENEVIGACSYFVEQMFQLDRGAIIKFSSIANVAVDMTYNKTQMLASISTYYASGTTALWDGIALGIEECAPEILQKAVIAFTDGNDNASSIGYQELPALAGDEIAIYTIGIGSGIQVDELTYVAENTGGFFIQISDPTQMAQVLEDIRQDMLDQYVIYYNSPFPDPDSTFRSVVINVDYAGEIDIDTIEYIAPNEPPCTIELRSGFAENLDLPREEGRPVRLNCKILSIVPMSEQKVYYRSIGAAFYEEGDLNWVGSNMYSFQVPAQTVVPPGVEFYFQATNALNYTTVYPSYQPASLPLSFAVEPNNAPRVIHVPPYIHEEDNDLSVSARIMDVTPGIDVSTLYYRDTEASLFVPVVMTNQGSEEYTAAIPSANLSAENDLEYFIRAVDDDGVASYWPPSSEPHFLEIVGYTPPVMPYCEITPMSASTIPASGDTLRYSPEVINPTPDTVPTDGWVSLYKPAGQEVYVLRFMDQNPLIPDSIYTWNLEELIKPADPPGTYWMYAQVGDFTTGDVWNYEAFTFMKSDADQVNGSGEAGFALIPNSLSLNPAYPNPFNSSVIIPFTLGETSRVRIVVYNQIGQEISVLMDGIQPVGNHRTTWNGLDLNGNVVSSGVYLYNIEAGGFESNEKLRSSGKIILVR